MMRASIAIPVLLAAALGAGPVAGQAMQLERRAYARLQQLRNELLSACLGADRRARTDIAEILAGDDEGTRFAAIARAIARARGAEADAPARFRAGVFGLVLPEVVNLAEYDAIHVTMYAPRIVPVVGSGKCEFEVEVLDAGGETIASARIVDDTTLEDLLRFRPTVALPLAERPDGEYAVTVRTILDGRDPRPTDVAFSARFDVRRDFKTRALALPLVVGSGPERRAALQAMVEAIPERRRDALSHAILTGAVWQVDRAYRGEPRRPLSDPVVELGRAERIFANLKADRDALTGLSGRLTIGLPISGGDAGGPATELAVVSLELPAAEHAERRRPLLLFVPGAPTWDGKVRRPGSPKSVAPTWIIDQLARSGFDLERRFHVAAMESPGRYRNAPRAVLAVLEHLRRLLPVTRRAVLIGEREGAYVAGRAALQDPGELAGLVLVCGGAMSKAELGRLGDLPVLAVTGSGHPTTAVLRSAAKVKGDADFRLLDGDDRPWPIAVGLAADEIEAFARDVSGLD